MSHRRAASIAWKLVFSLGSVCALIIALAMLPDIGSATAQQTAPDNTRLNRGDAQQGAVTADQQKSNSADLETTRKIRAALMRDRSLSTYAHNVKIVTQGGLVTLKGPVRDEKERATVESKADAVPGSSNVRNELEIAPPKSE